MGSSLKLGEIFGIPVRLHYTWFFIFLLAKNCFSFISVGNQASSKSVPSWECTNG